MIQKQILEKIEYLSNIKNNRKKILTEAAEALLNDYTDNKELTIFTELDSEDFYN